MEFELVITIVNRGFADDVMEVAKDVGAKGGTIIYGRGTSFKEEHKFFGIVIEPEKEVVLIVIEKECSKNVMENINNKVGINTKGRGISFSLPIEDVVGFDSK